MSHRFVEIPKNAVLMLVSSLALAACGSGSSPATGDGMSTDTTAPTEASISVVVSMFPIEEIVRNVGGDSVAITALVQPGRAAHDAELTARQLDQLADADAVFYGGMGFQPEVEKAIDALTSNAPRVDVFNAEGVSHLAADHSSDDTKDNDDDHDHGSGDEDPHVWLDPANMIAMTRTVVTTLSQIDPAAATTYASNGNSYIAELETIGSDIDTRFASCATRTVITSHDAFEYLAARAKLTTVPIAGVNPEDEPSAKELEAIADAARKAGATTVFFEALLPENLARTVANSIDVSVSALDPLESISESDQAAGETFVSLLRRNLDALSEGLRCT